MSSAFNAGSVVSLLACACACASMGLVAPSGGCLALYTVFSFREPTSNASCCVPLHKFTCLQMQDPDPNEDALLRAALASHAAQLTQEDLRAQNGLDAAAGELQESFLLMVCKLESTGAFEHQPLRDLVEAFAGGSKYSLSFPPKVGLSGVRVAIIETVCRHVSMGSAGGG